MFKYICIILLCNIAKALSENLFPVGNNVFCDADDERAVYLGTYKIYCEVGWRCNTNYANNKKYCLEGDTCLDKFSCLTDRLVSLQDGSLLDCGLNKVCNENGTWPCEPCLIIACLRTTYTCDATNEKLVNILEPSPATMLCPDNSVCNKNNVYPCSWCITANVPTESSTIGVDCNDGNAQTNTCRRGNSANTSVYYRCKAVWYWYEYDVVPCSELSNDPICKGKVYWCR